MAAAQTSRGVSADIEIPKVVLILVTLALALFGCVMVYSASAPSAISESGDAAAYLRDQLVFVVLGLAVAFIAWKVIPYRWWTGWFSQALWVLGLILLLLTAVMGVAALGAQRWLVIGPISLQPSEFVKIAVVLMAARIFSDRRAGAIDDRVFWVQVIVYLVVPVGLILTTQSDLGSSVIILVGILAVMWLGEVPVRYILALVALLVIGAILATVMSSYRSGRFLYLNPWNDGQNGQGDGYQIIHSYYAFSEGGIFGVGLGNSREKFLYLPESETDFIFAVIGEELGMVGALLVIAAFVVMLWAGMRIARAAFDDFGAMVAGGLMVMLVFQAFLNIGCVIGVFPTTGKPLPFISSGGSSMIASFGMIGIVLSVADEAASPSIYQKRRDDLRIVKQERDARGGSAPSGRSGSLGRGSSYRSNDRYESSYRSSGGYENSYGRAGASASRYHAHATAAHNSRRR